MTQLNTKFLFVLKQLNLQHLENQELANGRSVGKCAVATPGGKTDKTEAPPVTEVTAITIYFFPGIKLNNIKSRRGSGVSK